MSTALRWIPGRSAIRMATILATLVLLSGCALLSRQAGSPVNWDGEREPTTFVLEVENQNFNQARIYLIQNGQQQRLGIVNGNTTETFEARTWGGSEIRVRVDILAGGGFTTDPLVIWPGENVLLRIPSRA